MLRRIQELGARWFGKPDDEREFTIPDVKFDDQAVSPAVIRHLKVIEQAMLEDDVLEVGNRQRRLAKAGHEVPTKLSQVRELLRKYDAA